MHDRAARATRRHHRRGGLGDPEGGADVEREQAVERLVVHVEERLELVRAGVVDEHVERRQRADRGHGLVVGDAAQHRFDAPSRLPRHVVEVGGGARERERAGAPDPASRPGDQGDLAVQTKVLQRIHAALPEFSDARNAAPGATGRAARSLT